MLLMLELGIKVGDRVMFYWTEGEKGIYIERVVLRSESMKQENAGT